MSGLTFNGTNNTDQTITNDPFFIDISLKTVRESLRFDGSVSDMRLIEAIENALIEINSGLALLKNNGGSLAELATGQINNKPNTHILYFRAVVAHVGAHINEKYRSYDSTSTGQKRAEDMTPTIDEYRRDLRWAMRDLLGSARTTVDLI